MVLIPYDRLVSLDDILTENDRVFADTSALRANGSLGKYLNDYALGRDCGREFNTALFMENFASMDRILPFLKDSKVILCRAVREEIRDFVQFTCWAKKMYQGLPGKSQPQVHELLHEFYSRAMKFSRLGRRSLPSYGSEDLFYGLVKFVDHNLGIRSKKSDGTELTPTDDRLFAAAICNLVERGEKTGIVTSDSHLVYLRRTVPGVLIREELGPVNRQFSESFSPDLLRVYLRRESEYGDKLAEVELEDDSESRLENMGRVRKDYFFRALKNLWQSPSRNLRSYVA
ncbi:MAG: hypothetical protein PHF67_03255 [Candidatus Nanoarchaeia archaeon]|nr:hypothetical protein [Candidatus Nanoarchaeia archaeon]